MAAGKMNIHNIMEEFVTDRVNSLYDEVMKQKSVWLTCDCEHCRLDTICYVLNRVTPRYVVGGRGVTHNTNLIKENAQITIDIEKLCIFVYKDAICYGSVFIYIKSYT